MPIAAVAYDKGQLRELLPVYYNRFFPYDMFYKWLSYENLDKQYFPNREFSISTLDGGFFRFLSYKDQEEFMKDIKERVPSRIEIGAVFNWRPKERFMVSSIVAQEKELVFDIDVSDYDDVRNCCNEKSICDKCFRLMTLAVKIIDVALREDFGFKHLLWVFSGRRGIHCWVCDKEARSLNTAARSAVAEYLTIVRGGENMQKKVQLPPRLHHHVKRSVEIIRKSFKEVCVIDQDILGTENRMKQMLELIPEKAMRDDVAQVMSRQTTSQARWQCFEEIFKDYQGKKKMRQFSAHLVEEIMLLYAYPRLDVNVTKGLNHLLKAPLCIHPDTGNICVPIDVDHIDKFSLDSVPTIAEVITQLDQAKGEESSAPKGQKDYMYTSLQPAMEIFNKFIKNLHASAKGKRIALSDEKMTF
ncbi:unnamed protein product [Darwinula stevensoni]|uniref:DNA primase n=1 Tax=Darwinula stevensoni TaxID=69355 RepID=A0A7R9A003_9CRUS|nr:unnamed protein product [Darwinula stevensoni]CAG0879964.1 unnamed protein product [Darwinula stevensoni]